MGFSLELPVGWHVAADKESGRINLIGRQHEQVVIWPAWAPQGLDGPTAQVMVRQLAGRLGSDINVTSGWRAPQQVAENAVRSVGLSAGRAAIVMLCWIATAKGAAAFFYVIAGPEAVFRPDQERFSRILQSFRVTGPPPGRSEQPVVEDADVRYVSWTDPHEGAFSLEVCRKAGASRAD
jgi:hypothetical protein